MLISGALTMPVPVVVDTEIVDWGKIIGNLSYEISLSDHDSDFYGDYENDAITECTNLRVGDYYTVDIKINAREGALSLKFRSAPEAVDVSGKQKSSLRRAKCIFNDYDDNGRESTPSDSQVVRVCYWVFRFIHTFQ